MLDIITRGMETDYDSIVYGFVYFNKTPTTKHARLRIIQKCVYLHDLLKSTLNISPSDDGIKWGKLCEETVRRLTCHLYNLVEYCKIAILTSKNVVGSL